MQIAGERQEGIADVAREGQEEVVVAEKVVAAKKGTAATSPAPPTRARPPPAGASGQPARELVGAAKVVGRVEIEEAQAPRMEYPEMGVP